MLPVWELVPNQTLGCIGEPYKEGRGPWDHDQLIIEATLDYKHPKINLNRLQINFDQSTDHPNMDIKSLCMKKTLKAPKNLKLNQFWS